MSTNDEVRVLARMARVFEHALTEHRGITLTQFRVLAFLSDGDHAASALADWLAVSRPSVTSMVDGLVERGWVARTQDPDDRRRVLHQITDAGRTALDDAAGCLRGTLDDLYRHLDDDETDAVRAGLAALGTAMARHREAVRS